MFEAMETMKNGLKQCFEPAEECLKPPNIVFFVQTLFDGKKR